MAEALDGNYFRLITWPQKLPKKGAGWSRYTRESRDQNQGQAQGTDILQKVIMSTKYWLGTPGLEVVETCLLPGRRVLQISPWCPGQVVMLPGSKELVFKLPNRN
jgi:hypothetical protein